LASRLLESASMSLLGMSFEYSIQVFRPSTTKKFKQIWSSLTKLLGSSKWCAYFKWWFSCELKDFFAGGSCCVVIHEIKCINNSIHDASMSVVLWGIWMWMNCRPSTTKLTFFFHPWVVTTFKLTIFFHIRVVTTSKLTIFFHPRVVTTSKLTFFIHPRVVTTSKLTIFFHPLVVTTLGHHLV